VDANLPTFDVRRVRILASCVHPFLDSLTEWFRWQSAKLLTCVRFTQESLSWPISVTVARLPLCGQEEGFDSPVAILDV
jgi:hypothetical protein